MNANFVFALAVGIGVVAGLRSLMAPAAVAWAAHLGWLHLQGTSLGFMGSKIVVVIFSLLAIGELIGDKLPRVPKRTAVAPLLARIVTGGLSGACLCASVNQSLGIGAALGAVGAIIGAFGGYRTRKRLGPLLSARDFVIALLEDIVAISLAMFFVSR
ncbi:MAG: DUF4126 family protein [Chthoniobacterales bacterium]